MTSPDPTTPQTPPDPPGPRRLTRSSSDQVLGGVAGGLGNYFSVDPILFRIGFAVAAFAGGAGLLAYFALWFLVPDENGEGVKRPEGNQVALIVGGFIALLLLVGLLPGPDFFIWPGFFGLVVLGLLVAALVSADRGGTTGSRLLRFAIVALAVIAAAFLGVAAAVGTAFGGGAVVAGIVIVLGLALVAGAFGRGRRWLLVPALVLAAPAAMVQASGIEVEGGVGEREYRPATVSDLRGEYRLGAGEMLIDLRGVDFPAGRTVLDVDMGIGAVEIVVPDEVCVSSHVEIGVGAVEQLEHGQDGVDIDWTQQPRVDGDAKELFVDLDLDLGGAFIRHASDDRVWDHDHEDRGPFGDDFRDDATGPVAQAACTA